MSMVLNQDTAAYQEKGYHLYKKQLFSEEKLARLTQIFEEQLAQKGSKLSDELDTPHFRDERLLEFLLADEVLDLVEPFIGPNIALWSSHFICKDPFVGRATPWHEDSAYWKNRVDGFDQIITVWLALDRSSKENGCMRVIPGTHRNGLSEYEEVDGATNTFNTQIKHVDESQAVYFELEPGECSLHDSRIIHGAAPNKSPYRRCGYTMRYFSTNIKVLQDTDPRGGEFKVWLARGRDLAGNKYANVK
ncbi:phytanoyl-CoA dioxygenase family protein [Paenibacillus mucilaginosus]|uniref:Phytanoyl-CoA dioxygenase n=3 Tax=Paenibacillus mucilaginosus TaxID=61624 RepID=H6NCK5_9BACL|nr:phytanoyl-CoA dioxygenase family protein [Paenibacillus mucilaginosus]AEI40300.1 Phytanoyl-CoA dioxygenase [Paenibacillus mucilaginosus KNP414]AFC28934.1 phytanoyl-CoA dioxygenase [Paenibacillus mucilaginosus 3016]AFH61166.1 phytanoyl-CoA dioxygenase [Paenibacillus mucilaginosus K02]MCG7213340.1 phytanoyl-CoA dioxygenase family protein [Paenibacillus mucilaginosus]WDM29508.1 phytanoyl-CoA dioxygenase family protein [Paenibacillus mucilaginosus]